MYSTSMGKLSKDWNEEISTHTISKNNYYAFPGGVEVKDISAHLTSFGGQALQYVARATRLDGRNKGEQVKDLTKAIDFIQWEIERLENEDV